VSPTLIQKRTIQEDKQRASSLSIIQSKVFHLHIIKHTPHHHTHPHHYQFHTNNKLITTSFIKSLTTSTAHTPLKFNATQCHFPSQSPITSCHPHDRRLNHTQHTPATSSAGQSHDMFSHTHNHHHNQQNITSVTSHTPPPHVTQRQVHEINIVSHRTKPHTVTASKSQTTPPPHSSHATRQRQVQRSTEGTRINAQQALNTHSAAEAGPHQATHSHTVSAIKHQSMQAETSTHPLKWSAIHHNQNNFSSSKSHQLTTLHNIKYHIHQSTTHDHNTTSHDNTVSHTINGGAPHLESCHGSKIESSSVQQHQSIEVRST